MSSRSKVALLTGGSGGIGRATARALIRAGFVVYAPARREAIADLAAHGQRVPHLDVTDETSMASVVAAIEAAHGAVDLLVNNAGYGMLGPMENVALADLRAQFEVNVFGLLRMSQLVLPGMRRRGSGRIVNIGSVGGLFTSPGSGAYHLSKYAVESLSDAMRAEVAGFGVDVVLLEPTGVRTPFIRKMVATMPVTRPGDPYAAFKRAVVDNSLALFRPGSRAVVEPEVVASVVVVAATAHRPRARYKVGMVARILPTVRRVLPDRAWDTMVMRQLGAARATTVPPA